MKFGLNVIVAGLLLMPASLLAQSSPFDIAEHTPGYRYNFEGQRSWENGFYFDARHRFERAAWWGDKLAQHNLGVMYYRGDGVEANPAKAWAWFALAAERGYPDFVALWETLWLDLDENERERAKEYLAELEPRYSDRVAVDRTQRRLDRQRREMTGSRTGFISNLRIIDRSGRTRDGEDFYSAEKWDFRQIIEMETELFKALGRGQVSFGDFEVIEEEVEVEDEDTD